MEKTNRFYIADLKKYDAEHDGFEFDSTISKGIFVYKDDKYINILDPLDERSVYKRSRFYGEYSSDEQFGTKLVLATGDGIDKYAWILTGEAIDTTLDKMYDFVLDSDDFYKDRLLLAVEKKSERPGFSRRLKLERVIDRDINVFKKMKRR